MSHARAQSRRRQGLKPMGLNLTAMIDIFTVLLIFLILTFVSDEKAIDLASGSELPHAKADLHGLPKIQIQILSDHIDLDGKNVGDAEGLIAALKKLGVKAQSIVVIADQGIQFQSIDHAIAALTRAGFSNFHFLTSQAEEERQ